MCHLFSAEQAIDCLWTQSFLAVHSWILENPNLANKNKALLPHPKRSTSCHSINSSSATHFRCFAVTFQTGHGLKAAGLIWLMLMWLHVPSCPPSPRSAALTKPQTSVPLVGMCATHEKHTEILKWDPPIILQNSTPSGIPVIPTGRLPTDTINFNQQFQEQPHTFNLGPNILCSQATHLGRARDS